MSNDSINDEFDLNESNFSLECRDSSRQVDAKDIIEILIYSFVVVFNFIIFELSNMNINEVVDVV